MYSGIGADAAKPLSPNAQPHDDDKLGLDDDDFPVGQMNSSYANPVNGSSGPAPSQNSIRDGLVAAINPNASFWKLDFYRSFFDTNDKEVATRLLRALNPKALPIYADQSLTVDVESGSKTQPELCGPFWVTTTLIILLAILGNLSTYLISDTVGNPDLKKLVRASSILYIFFTVVPTIMWFFLRRWESSFTLTEIMSVYGYSLTVFVPASVLCMVNVSFLRWIVVSSTCFLSCLVVFKHIASRIVNESSMKQWVFIALLVIPHFCLAIYVKLEHFP